PQTIYLKALTIPLYHPVQQGCYQSNNQLVPDGSSINLDNSNMPLILNQLLHSERIDQHQSIVPKQTGQTLTLNIVSSPVLPSSSCQNVLVGSPGKSKNAGKYICKHCGRDCLKPSVLEKHIRSHTGERPFPCTTCGIAFKTQSNLYKHRRTQTHVNNTRLPSESDNSGILEENEKATDIMSHQGAKRDNICEKQRSGNKEISSEMSTAVDKSQRITIGDSNWPDTSQGVTEREPVQDTPNLSSPVILAESLHQRRKMQEQRFSTTNKHIQLQRQQATYSDRQWDCKPSDYKLKKCESTDSGYLSRSDSTEQQILTSSPLHSLCEQSTELEKETAFSGLRCTAGSSAKPESAEKATALMLEKKKLEEHISKLISHNKAVVDDTQLDNVRPRKTVLSKQGSIDLPMPYTYKDSFHFDIKSLDVNRKKNLALCSAKSTFTPIEKSKPLFFHSVPTQFSTTIDCVPVTRSNSLPFVESTRMAHDRVGSSKVPSLTRQPLNTGSSSLLHSNNLATSSVDFPNSHPRALVRQTAVDDLPLSNTVSYYSTSEETKDTKKPEAGGEVVNAKSKKSTQRKFKMFSQEKWQMYGDETFKKIYQKMKSSQTSKKLNQSGKKDTDNIDFTPDSKEAASGDGVPQPKDVRSSLKEKAGRFTELMETAHSVNAEISVISKTSPKHDCSNKHSSDKYIGGKNTLLALSSHEMRFQLKQRASQLNTNMLHADSLQMHNNQFEESCPGRESNTPVSECENILKSDRENHSSKETSQHAQMPLRVHNSSTGESTQVFQKLPSERKKLKVEELNSSNNPALKLSPRPCSENNAVGETVKLTDCNSVNAASAALVQQSLKGEQNLNSYLNDSIGCAKSMEYEKTLKPHIGPIYSNDNSANLLLQSAKVSMASLSECLVPELERVTSPLKKSAFSPKYILKLPQEENTTDLPLLMRPGPESMPVISLPVPLTKASYTINSSSTIINISTKTGDIFQNQSCRHKEITKDAWKDTEDKDNLSSQMQADKKFPTMARRAPGSSTSSPITKSCASKPKVGLRHHVNRKPVVHITRMASKEFKKHMINPYIVGWDTDGSSSSILKDISPGLQDLQYSVCSKDKSNYFCHSFGTLYCHALGSQHKELPALSQVSVTCLSGNARILSTKGSFPSLNAEPQLTWCCLTRSLPLPAEQKEKADSAYSSLHIYQRRSRHPGPQSVPVSVWDSPPSVASTSYSQQSSSKAGGCGVLENVSEREKKERLYRREKFTTNKSKRSHKQKKMKINPKWSKGNHVHGYTQLKTKRLSKQHWLPNRALDTLKKHLPYHSRDSLNQCEKSYSPASNLQVPQLQGEFSCPTSDKPVSKGNNDKKEDKNHKNNSGIFSLAEHSSNFRQKGKLDGKDITTPNYKPSRGNLSLQNISAMPGLPMVTYSCSSPAKAATEQTNNDLDICCLVTQPLTLQKPFPVEPQPNVYSDPVESSFWSFPFDFIGTEVTAPFFVWPKADHKNILNVESQSQSFAAAYPLVQTSGKEEHPMEGNSYSSLKGKLIPSSKTVCSASLGSKVNTLPQTSITSTSLPSTANIQGMNTSHDPHECVNKNGAYLQSDGQGKLNETGTNTFKEPSFPSSPTESTASSETPSRTYKKRGLERMRKQTRVEYDDTSSDDEDRLVIEI
uniref:Zinc finger protein 831 n=1 Tax=Pelodiscus sinensis TaxID=13735 RepID=K7FEK0_PELSI